MNVAHLDLAEFLAIAELVLQEPGDDIAWIARFDLAGVGVGCARIVKSHPRPDGNKRVGFMCMIEFCLSNGLAWTPPRKVSAATGASGAKKALPPRPSRRSVHDFLVSPRNRHGGFRRGLRSHRKKSR